MPDYRAIAADKARKYGLPVWFFVNQIGAESNFDPNALSPAGASGIAQIMPGTAEAWGVDPSDPEAALDAAAREMAKYVDQFGLEGALRAYNAGPGAVERSKSFDETNAYVRKIMGGKRDVGPTQPTAAPGVGTPSVGSTSKPNPFPQIAALGTGQKGPYAETLSRGWDLLGKIWEQKYGGQQASPATPSLAQATGVSTTGGEGGLGGLREAFYDPVGGWDNGQSIGPIGGHGTHGHFGGGPKTISRIITAAQKAGLRPGENAAVGPVGSGHTEGSWHFRHNNRGGVDVTDPDPDSGTSLDDFFRDILRRARWK